jgi:hypothetical protein
MKKSEAVSILQSQQSVAPLPKPEIAHAIRHRANSMPARLAPQPIAVPNQTFEPPSKQTNALPSVPTAPSAEREAREPSESSELVQPVPVTAQRGALSKIVRFFAGIDKIDSVARKISAGAELLSFALLCLFFFYAGIIIAVGLLLVVLASLGVESAIAFASVELILAFIATKCSQTRSPHASSLFLALCLWPSLFFYLHKLIAAAVVSGVVYLTMFGIALSSYPR